MTPNVLIANGKQVLNQRQRELHETLAQFPASLFQFDPRMRDGWLADRYFVRTAETLAHAGKDPVVTMQVFSKQKNGVLAGVYEAIRMLQTQLAPGYSYRDLTIETLLDGDRVNQEGEWETVMHITGPYRAFAHLETTYLGVMARRTLVASNARAAIEAANGKPVLFMAARHDDWRIQTPDGYAAKVGGTNDVSSDAGGAWWGAQGFGTMPHAMIAAFGGDTVEATLAFARYARDKEPGIKVMSLVDYHNDVVTTSLRVAQAMEKEFGKGALAGVRLDTSERLIDESLLKDPELWGREQLTGVNPHLVRKLRKALDSQGFGYVKIVVSGGFTPAKIRAFEKAGVPADAYGVGSSLLGHNNGTDGLMTSFDFTADIVKVDGNPESKIGRRARSSLRFVKLDWDLIERLDNGEEV